jgi:hypothetical protein
LRGGFVHIRCDEDKRAVGAGHGSPPGVVADCWTFSSTMGPKPALLIARFGLFAT